MGLGANPVTQNPEDPVLQRAGYGCLLGVVQHQVCRMADKLDAPQGESSGQLRKEMVKTDFQADAHAVEFRYCRGPVARVEQLLLPAEQVNLAIRQQRPGPTRRKQNRGVEQRR